MNDSIEQLKSHGFTILKNAIPMEQINNWIETYQNYFKENPEYTLKTYTHFDGRITVIPNGMELPEFQHILVDIINNKPFVDVLNGVCDGKIKHTHGTDVHMNMPGAKGLHADITKPHWWGEERVCEEDTDPWVGNIDGETFKVFRYAIYFQEHKGEEWAFQANLGSHTKLGIYDPTFAVQPVEYKAEVDPGDIVMFDQRLGHIGGPHLNGRDRLVVYGAFGKDNIFTDIQIKSNIKRQKEERLLNPELKFDTYKFPENLQKEFDKAGISYIKEI